MAYQTRQPAKDIGATIGVSEHSVWQRAHLLGLERKPKAEHRPLWQETRTCITCGVAFVVTKAWVGGGRPGRACSRQCANRARLKALYAGIIEDNSIPEPNSGCWLWLGPITGAGYGAVQADGKGHGAHKLSYALAYGDPHPAAVIRHLCNNRACVNPVHLASGTTKDNADDMVRADRHARGSRHPGAKLSEEVIPLIVGSHRDGASIRSLAREHGVSPKAIQLVLRGVTWKHVGATWS